MGRIPSFSRKHGRYQRSLRFESLEDRRVLAPLVDLVFLVDETGSGQASDTDIWLKDQLFADTSGFNHISEKLAAENITDVRYGLIGFGHQDTVGFARSYIVDPQGADRLFGDADALDAALNEITFSGDKEDGWDGFEHLIAEYKFRPGAVPVAVLLQNTEGRNNQNLTLTRNGILATLESKNVLVNTLVFGDSSSLFDLTGYGGNPDIRILGVQSDPADLAKDGKHDYVAFNTSTQTVVSTFSTTVSQAMQVSHNGSNTGETGLVSSGKSILLGQDLTEGIGGSATGDYKAKAVPFSAVDMVGATNHSNLSTAINLPANFSYYGSSFSKIWISDSGTIRLGNGSDPGSVGGTNPDLTLSTSTRPSFPVIAALWDELFAGPATAQVLWKVIDVDQDSQDDLVVEWHDFSYNSDSINDGFDPITFQAILYANGHIGFNYVDLDSYRNHQVSSAALQTGGISSTVGLWKGSAESISVEAGKYVPGLHSLFGSTLADFFDPPTETNDSYVRLAWDTGGAAWDLGVVDESGPSSPIALALRDEFISGLAAQIVRAEASGQVYEDANLVLALNVGGDALGDYEADTLFAPVTTTIIEADAQTIIDVASNSIPENTPVEVFETARESTVDTMHWSFDEIGQGQYIVELLFADLNDFAIFDPDRAFDILLEGNTMLDDYVVAYDRARIVPESSTKLSVDLAGSSLFPPDPAAVVKRFVIDLNGSDGLQIDLVQTDPLNTLPPILNGIRIYQANDPPPTITDVILKGTIPGTSLPWHESAVVSMKDRIESGQQFHSISTYGANTIEVHFSEQISIADPSGFVLQGHNGRIIPTTPILDPTGTLVTLTFEDLIIDKYALHISDGAVTDIAGNQLDGDWMNEGDNGTPDNIGDDFALPFVVGDGQEGSFGGEFRLHFAYLPSDYDGDGDVDGNDFLLLESGDPSSDGNGDGITDGTGDDLTLWQTYFGFYRWVVDAVMDFDFSGGTLDANDTALWLTNSILADFNDDEIVDGIDLMIWQENYGTALTGDTYSQGDSDLDGDADGNDFMRMLSRFNHQSAWYVPHSGLASALTTGLPPQVLNVIMSGSQSTHDPYSFDTVDGSGAQLASVPVGLADTISIVFSESVNVAAESLIVVGLTTANVPQLAEFSYDSLTYTATWRFEGWALADNYLLYLSDSITDTEGNFLDGEWTNPASISTTNPLVSTFPSGDGISGGSFNFVMTLMPDVNQDNIVNYTDYYTAYYGELYGVVGDFSNGDFNGNGIVDQEDVDLVNSLLWVSLQNIEILVDLNGDLRVDGDDLAIIRNNFGMTGATQADGDVNGDQLVNELDVDLAFAQYGLGLDLVA